MKLTSQKYAPTSSRWTFVGTRNGYLFWRSHSGVLYAQLKSDDGSSQWYKVQR